MGINLVGHIFFILYNFGYYIPENGYWYFYELSLSIEALLFSTILAKRLNHTKALEKAVQTQKTLTQELHHRVKNNLQFIISLYRLKLREKLDTQGKATLKEVEQNIRSIGKMHEVLYAQAELEKTDAVTYFKTLIDELQNAYPLENIHIEIRGNMEIELKNVIHVGIIINELITNAIKHAFDGTKQGNIIISMGKEENVTVLKVADDGNGFKKKELQESFGLTMVKHLVDSELKGKYTIDGSAGTTHTITW